MISIVVPVYNKELYIRKCLNSIINQTYKDIEIILVDDESTDASKTICEECAKKDSRIILIEQTNGGAAKARNTGISFAKGEYIAFIDADDFIEEDYIQNLLELAKKHEADIVQCNRYNSDSVRPEDNLEETVYTGDDKNGLIYSELYIPTINPVCKLYRKSLFDGIHFTEGMIYEDECIMHRLLYSANKVVHINRYMYCVVLSQNSVMRSEFSLKRLDILKALEDRLLFYKQHNLKSLYAKTLYTYIGISFKISKDVKKLYSNEIQLIKKLKRNMIIRLVESLFLAERSLKNKMGLLLRVCGIIKF